MKKILFYTFSFVAISSFGQTLQDSLVVYYSFNGNANDISGNNHHGTVNGASLVSDRFNNANSAYDFDGISDFIVVPHHSDLNFDYNDDFSISLWLKASSSQVHIVGNQKRNVILSKWENNGPTNDDYPYNIRVFNSSSTDQGKITSFRFNKSCNYSPESRSVTTINDQNWHHIILMHANGYLSTYIDCEQEDTFQEINSSGLTNLRDLFIGRQGGINNPAWFRGVIDDIRIYNRALSPMDIDSLCNIYVGVNEIQDIEPLLDVYPNPSNGRFSIEFKDYLKGEIQIFNSHGELINKEKVDNHRNYKINLPPTLSEGIYFIVYSYKNITYSKRIVLKK